MKKILLSILLTAAIQMLSAQGITFFEGDFAAAKAKAKTEKKYIFMDCYTTWCGPCKKMSAETFTQKEAGDFFNPDFINMKMDMEKGEGKNIAELYEVNAYPMLLFFTPEGELVHRGVGYQSVEALISLAKEAMNPATQFVVLEKRYKSGDREPSFLRTYAYACKTLMNGEENYVAQAYLETQKDWGTKENMEVIVDLVNDPNSKPFEYMISKREAFEQAFGANRIEEHINQAAVSMSMGIVSAEGAFNEEAIRAIYHKLLPNKEELGFVTFQTGYYLAVGDWDNFAKASLKYVKLSPELPAGELNMLAWSFYQYIDDKALLSEALKWSERSVKEDANFYNIDTNAALLYKLGKKRKAKKMAKKAIKLAKEQNIDYAGTQELLDKM